MRPVQASLLGTPVSPPKRTDRDAVFGEGKGGSCRPNGDAHLRHLENTTERSGVDAAYVKLL